MTGWKSELFGVGLITVFVVSAYAVGRSDAEKAAADPIVPPARIVDVADTAYAVPTIWVPAGDGGAGEEDLRIRIVTIGSRECVVAWIRPPRKGTTYALTMDCHVEEGR